MIEVRAIAFDLDGTLVDSAQTISNALRCVRERRGLSDELTLESVRQWVSLGAPQLVRNALGAAFRDESADVDEFRKEYARLTTGPEYLYDGTIAVLEAFSASGIPMAVCSNKPHALCLRVLEDTGIRARFGAVLGGDAVPQSKPHPGHLLAAIEALGTHPDAALYVGDSSVDMRTAAAAHVPFVLARYGYADPSLREMNPSLYDCIDSMSELPELVARRQLRGAQ